MAKNKGSGKGSGWKVWAPRAGIGLVVTQLVLLFISVFVTNLMPWACGGSMELPPVMQMVRACPEARRALGDNIRLTTFSMGGCNSSGTGDGADVSAHLSIRGDKARGKLRYMWEKKKGKWVIVYAEVKVDDKKINIAACKPAKNRPRVTGSIVFTSAWHSFSLHPDTCTFYAPGGIVLRKKGLKKPRVDIHGFRQNRPYLDVKLSKMDEVELRPKGRMKSTCKTLKIDVRNLSKDRNHPVYEGSVELDCAIKTDQEERTGHLRGKLTFARCK